MMPMQMQMRLYAVISLKVVWGARFRRQESP